jgi:NAD(P)-dependent dehydrogenase (short-subunit alcohol dehydrogenase family)
LAVDRIVLVTGGGNGLGKAVAARFLADGATVFITGRRRVRQAARGRHRHQCRVDRRRVRLQLLRRGEGRPGAGEPADIAETAYFLASPGARHITGQTVHVNGGAHTTR